MDKAGGQHHNEPGNQFTAHSHRTNTEPPPPAACALTSSQASARARESGVCVLRGLGVVRWGNVSRMIG